LVKPLRGERIDHHAIRHRRATAQSLVERTCDPSESEQRIFHSKRGE
jgi:hypothetical protein